MVNESRKRERVCGHHLSRDLGEEEVLLAEGLARSTKAWHGRVSRRSGGARAPGAPAASICWILTTSARYCTISRSPGGAPSCSKKAVHASARTAAATGAVGYAGCAHASALRIAHSMRFLNVRGGGEISCCCCCCGLSFSCFGFCSCCFCSSCFCSSCRFSSSPSPSGGSNGGEVDKSRTGGSTGVEIRIGAGAGAGAEADLRENHRRHNDDGDASCCPCC